MKRHRLPLLVLTATAAIASTSSLSAARGGRPAITTLAYIVTECHSDAGGIIARQALRVRRGYGPPLTIMEFSLAQAIPDPLGLCRILGDFRNGNNAVAAGAFQRIAVSPDGSLVVFEVTSRFAVFPILTIPAEQEGVYVVGANGRGLRRLGPASRDPNFLITPEPRSPVGVVFPLWGAFSFRPHGHEVAYTDLGPGPGGEDAPQVMVLDLESGRRAQVTHLAATASNVLPGTPLTGSPRFIARDRIVFFTHTNPDGSHPGFALFAIEPNGSGLRPVVLPIAAPGSRIFPRFGITGGQRSLLSYDLPGTPANDVLGFAPTIHEVFLLDGKNLLQLTNFRRTDTVRETLSVSGRRAFFRASADPLGRNPTENCQLFSVDVNGAHLRQVTRFDDGARSVNGCQDGPPPGCVLADVHQDPRSGTLVFFSGCDPRGPSHVGGQIYAVRPDGSGLEALTDTRGLVVDPDGAVTVELPGPFGYSGVVR